MESSDICIAVATHKAYRMPEDAVYMPIHVGKALHPDLDLCMQGDDTGESISSRNAEFSELTALYWIWKNVDADYKGLVHYRRHFGTPRSIARDRFDKIATLDDFSCALDVADIVLPKKRNYYIETVYSHYAHTFPGEQLNELGRVLRDMEPDYVAAYDDVLAARCAHIFNMFVMDREKFDSYCSWLFPILFELVNRIDPQSYGDAFQARYPGRVSERLLDAWIATNGYDYVELPVVSPEPVDWPRKIGGFLAAKFMGKKYSKSF